MKIKVEVEVPDRKICNYCIGLSEKTGNYCYIFRADTISDKNNESETPCPQCLEARKKSKKGE